MPATDEVRRLLGDTRYALESVSETCSSIGEAEDLPSAFLKVAQRFRHTQEFFEAIKSHIAKSNPDEEACQDMKPAMEVCKDKAKRLDEIYYEVVPKSDTPPMERYKSAARGDRVEDLMKAVLRSALGLAEKPALKAAAETHVKELQEGFQEISTISRSLPDDNSAQNAFHNYSTGWMNINMGSAPQHNNNSSGTQLNGTFNDLQLPSPLPPK